MRKINIYILSLVCVCLSACQLRETHQQSVRPIAVEVQTMTQQTSVFRHTYVGEIEEKNRVSIGAQTAGRIVAVYVERGEKVEAGQLLLCIDSTQAVNTRLSAEAVLRQAEDGFTRACVLYKEGGITEQKRVEIETKLAEARSMYASAARMVAECRVTAPVAGVISECHARVGETVAPGIPLLTIMDIDGFVVRFAVPETEIAAIHIGDKARMEIAAIEVTDLPLVITEKSMVASKITHSYEVVAALQTSANVLPGMSSKVSMETDIVSGYVLPQNCIQVFPDGARVWFAEDNIAIRKNITIDQYVENGVLVTTGIQSGDKIITKGYQKLWQRAEITY